MTDKLRFTFAFIPSCWGVRVLQGRTGSNTIDDSRELHLMRFDKMLDVLTLFFSSDFASTFYVALFLHYLPLFTVKVSHNFPALGFIWRLRRMAVNIPESR